MGLTIVTGPPCAGKSTHVDEQRQPGDVVIDFDRIAAALGHDGDQVDWSKDSSHRHLARVARAAVLKTVLAGDLRDRTVWVVETNPERWQVAAYRRAGGTTVELDPGRDECHARAAAADRPAATHGEIDTWYDQHRPAAAEEYFA
jgi:predicted kinase